ncbi:MAG: insulinase family protein [Betaproteobacteria bacterium]|nr:insulinase family protein [Betaproteobacteria bacterium]
MKTIVSALLALLVAFAPPAQAAPAQKAVAKPAKVAAVEGVVEYRLGNGLKVLLVPDPSIDTITVNMVYLVGSRNEGYGESGMAHLLEHLLFRGTRRIPNIKLELTRRGAQYNGTTSLDRTTYYETFPASPANLDWALGLEADRMVNANVSRKDLDAEMTVVRNEFESGENSAFGVLRERVTATAYLWHNYGSAIIGARSDIENAPISRVQAFYRKHYRPDNAVLVISGRFDEATALRLAAKHFARIPKPRGELVPTYTAEPTQDGERTVTLRRAGDVQMVSAFYHMPPGVHADYAAVDVLVALLSQVPGGRLHKALVEKGVASFVFGTNNQQREAGSAYFGASVRQDLPLEAARDALLATLEGFARNPVTEEEVERARVRLVNDIEMTIADSRSLALTLSDSIAMGDWRTLFLHRDRLKAVTVADVQRVATAYLKTSNRTLGLFLPTREPDRAEIPPVPDVAAMVKDYRGTGPIAAGEAFDPTPANIEARVIRRTLPGGMKLALLPKKTRGGTVVAQLSLRWGNEEAKAGRSTACGIASAMLLRGSRDRTREQIANEFARIKAHVGVGGEGGSIETLRENLPAALKLVAEVLRHPAFPESEFEQLRRSALTSIDIEGGKPSALASLELSRHLNPYPKEHWFYRAGLQERAERLKALTLEDVKRCYADFYGASNSELAVVGDFDPEEITRVAIELFGAWSSPKPYQRIQSPYYEAPPLKRVIETPDKANASYRAAMNLRLRDDSPDYVALALGNRLLGEGSASRLVRRIREREGISYSVGSYLSASSFDERGVFGIYAICAPQNSGRLESLVREELRKALDEGFSAEEVEAAKKSILQARQVARNQDSSIAEKLVHYLELGRTFAWDAEQEKRIAALTPEEIVAALRRYIDPSRLSIVEAGDFANNVASNAKRAASK